MPARGLTRVALLLGLGLLLAGCGGIGSQFTQALTPRAPHPTYKIGGPYTVKGVTYYPHIDYAYDQTGLASWYGEAFDGQYTANGEIFDLNQITAAHKTLPLPSIVEVINLQNNRALRVRINDRGPFVEGRIIDVSRRVAQLLGFERSGTATVRVRVLKDESLQAAAAAAQGIVSNGSAFATTASVTPPSPEPSVAPVIAAAVLPPQETVGSTMATSAYLPPPQPRIVSTAHHFLVQSPRWRMEIGPVDTEEEANRALAQMIQSGYRDAHIVMN